MLKECGFQSPEVWGQHVPLETPWARLSKPLLWARVSPQNRTSRELEILGSSKNQGRKKSIPINSPSLVLANTRDISQPPCPARATGWDCSPRAGTQGEDVPWWLWTTALAQSSASPSRQGGQIQGFGNNLKLRLFRAALSSLYNCQSFSPPLSASLRTAGMLTLLLVLSASSLTSAPEAKAPRTELP